MLHRNATGAYPEMPRWFTILVILSVVSLGILFALNTIQPEWFTMEAIAQALQPLGATPDDFLLYLFGLEVLYVALLAIGIKVVLYVSHRRRKS